MHGFSLNDPQARRLDSLLSTRDRFGIVHYDAREVMDPEYDYCVSQQSGFLNPRLCAWHDTQTLLSSAYGPTDFPRFGDFYDADDPRLVEYQRCLGELLARVVALVERQRSSL